jgi:hypothetical protein
MNKSWSIPIAVLFSLALLITSYHYHADLNGHPSCIYCKLAKDLSSVHHTVHPLPAAPVLMEGSLTAAVYQNLFLPSLSLAESRAPPA